MKVSAGTVTALCQRAHRVPFARSPAMHVHFVLYPLSTPFVSETFDWILQRAGRRQGKVSASCEEEKLEPQYGSRALSVQQHACQANLGLWMALCRSSD